MLTFRTAILFLAFLSSHAGLFKLASGAGCYQPVQTQITDPNTPVLLPSPSLMISRGNFGPRIWSTPQSATQFNDALHWQSEVVTPVLGHTWSVMTDPFCMFSGLVSQTSFTNRKNNDFYPLTLLLVNLSEHFIRRLRRCWNLTEKYLTNKDHAA